MSFAIKMSDKKNTLRIKINEIVTGKMSEIALALAQELISASPAVNEEGKQVLYVYNCTQCIENQHDLHQ